LHRFGRDTQYVASGVGQADIEGKRVPDLYFAEGMSARIAIELLSPCPSRRQTKQAYDYNDGEGSHGCYLGEALGFEANSEVHLS